MILTCLYLTGCGREEVPYLDTTQTQEQTVETERTEQKETLKSDQTVQVYVCGEVAAPGVYQLKDGMRICDAVEAAGGQGSGNHLQRQPVPLWKNRTGGSISIRQMPRSL